jgi:hypothetical protein
VISGLGAHTGKQGEGGYIFESTAHWDRKIDTGIKWGM